MTSITDTSFWTIAGLFFAAAFAFAYLMERNARQNIINSIGHALVFATCSTFGLYFLIALGLVLNLSRHIN